MSIAASRSSWGAQYGRGEDVSRNLPWAEVVVHTEAGADLEATMTVAQEQAEMRNVEHFHSRPVAQGGRGWNGIAYTFIVFPSGRGYEGRGWGRSGAHTEGRNSVAAGICFAGHGDHRPATPAALATVRALIREGIATGQLRSAYVVSPHAKYSKKGKTCPGLKIRPQLGELEGVTTTTDVQEDDMPFTEAELKKIVGDEVNRVLGPVLIDLAEQRTADKAELARDAGHRRQLEKAILEGRDQTKKILDALGGR